MSYPLSENEENVAPESPATPVITMNGTDPGALAKDFFAATSAIEQAILAVDNAAPHMRDYYMVDGLWQKARTQHRDRIALLQQVHTQLQFLAFFCVGQQQARGMRDNDY